MTPYCPTCGNTGRKLKHKMPESLVPSDRVIETARNVGYNATPAGKAL